MAFAQRMDIMVGSSFVCLFYILATSEVISGRVPICDSRHSWRIYSAAPLGDQATSCMTLYPTRSHYPEHWAAQSLPYPSNTKYLVRNQRVSIFKSFVWFHQLGSNKYQFLCHWFDSTRVLTREVWIARSPKTGEGRSTHSTIPSDLEGSS